MKEFKKVDSNCPYMALNIKFIAIGNEDQRYYN